MKLHFSLIIAASLIASACSTTSAPATNTKPAQTDEIKKANSPADLVPSTAAIIDISASSTWTATELLWPESPFMKLADTSAEDKQINGLSFNCNTDTGSISGSLQNQSSENTGKAAAFSLRTSNGEAMTLLGMYAQNKMTKSTDFVFKTDWRAMKAISNAERVDFIDPNGISQLALVKDEAPHRGNTQLLASSENFEDTQVKLYYYCNPK